jgi:hypothetical protein
MPSLDRESQVKQPQALLLLILMIYIISSFGVGVKVTPLAQISRNFNLPKSRLYQTETKNKEF